MAIHLTGSFAVSGSIDAQSYTQNGLPLEVTNAISASYALTASHALNGGGGGGADLTAVDTDITPIFDEVYDIGSTDKKFYDAYLTNKVQLGDTASIQVDEDSDLIINSNVIISGSDKVISANIGDFGKLTISGSTIKNNTSDGYSSPDVNIHDDLNIRYTVTVGTWSAGGALITPRLKLAGAGEQDAAVAFGGSIGAPSYAVASCTEEYNGSSWSAGGPLITARTNFAGAGTQNAGLAFGGNISFPSSFSCTEEYDGSSWSAGGALITARYFLAGAGTQDAGLAFGGCYSTCTEEYNGTSWTAGGALSSLRDSLGGTGTQNAALAIGGRTFQPQKCTEEYNGTSWSTGGPLITPLADTAAAGTQNAGLVFGGSTRTASTSGCTQQYDGTSWSTGGNLITARRDLAGAGTQNAGLAFGGCIGYPDYLVLSCTEEYNTPGELTSFSFKQSADTMHFIANSILSGSSNTSDAEAASNGVPIGGIYHCNGVLKIRLE